MAHFCNANYCWVADRHSKHARIQHFQRSKLQAAPLPLVMREDGRNQRKTYVVICTVWRKLVTWIKKLSSQLSLFFSQIILKRLWTYSNMNLFLRCVDRKSIVIRQVKFRLVKSGWRHVCDVAGVYKTVHIPQGANHPHLKTDHHCRHGPSFHWNKHQKDKWMRGTEINTPCSL